MKEDRNNEGGDGLLVIGAGFGRTGTLSIKVALETLGYPCYHMEEVLKNWHFPQWLNQSKGPKEPIWDEVFDGFQATVDFPACLYFEELMSEYPEAKVLLSTRDEEGWWKSFSSTLLEGRRCVKRSFWLNLLPPIRTLTRFNSEVVFGIFGTEPVERSKAIQVFGDHNSKVRSIVPKERLLEFNVRDGWVPLCQFLEKPVPSTPFPHVNDTVAFRRRIRLLRLINFLIGSLAIAIILTLLYWAFQLLE